VSSQYGRRDEACPVNTGGGGPLHESEEAAHVTYSCTPHPHPPVQSGHVSSIPPY
jgi:hypothetical protein